MNEREAILIEAARRGDTDAFRELLETYQNRIYFLALNYTGSHSDAEDLVQEVFLRVFLKLKTFQGRSSFFAWMRTITVRTFLNHARRARRHRSLEAADWEHAHGLSPRSLFEQKFQQKLLADEAGQILHRFPERQRLMFLLKHQESISYREIAEQFHCSIGTVKKTVYRVLSELRRQLRAWDAPGGSGEFVRRLEGKNH